MFFWLNTIIQNFTLRVSPASTRFLGLILKLLVELLSEGLVEDVVDHCDGQLNDVCYLCLVAREPRLCLSFLADQVATQGLHGNAAVGAELCSRHHGIGACSTNRTHRIPRRGAGPCAHAIALGSGLHAPVDAVLIGFHVLAFNATSFSTCVLLAANVLALNLGAGTADVLRGRSCAQQAYGRVLL